LYRAFILYFEVGDRVIRFVYSCLFYLFITFLSSFYLGHFPAVSPHLCLPLIGRPFSHGIIYWIVVLCFMIPDWIGICPRSDLPFLPFIYLYFAISLISCKPLTLTFSALQYHRLSALCGLHCLVSLFMTLRRSAKFSHDPSLLLFFPPLSRWCSLLLVTRALASISIQVTNPVQ